jgi:hypothetical protein
VDLAKKDDGIVEKVRNLPTEKKLEKLKELDALVFILFN